MGWIQFPLGDMTAASARDRDADFYRAVAAITNAGPRIAKKRIWQAAGNTLLRNLFRDEWPHVDDVGDLTVAQAKTLGMVRAIGLATFLDDEVVEIRLDEARGNRCHLQTVPFRPSLTPACARGVDMSRG